MSGGADNLITIMLTCTLNVLPRQKTAPVCRDRELPRAPVVATSATLRFAGTVPADLPTEMPAGGAPHSARLRVDGIDSPYLTRHPKPRPPGSDPAQRITMP